MNFRKLLFATAILSSGLMILSGCGNRATTATQQQQAQDQDQKKVSLSFDRGQYVQAQGMLSVPVIIKNTGTNNTILSSQNFKLEIDGHSFPIFQATGEPTDFHTDFASGGTWTNVISFYLGIKLTPKQLKSVRLTYLMDNNEKVSASMISTSTAQSEIQDNTTNTGTTVGQYYNKSIQYLEQAKDSAKQGTEPSTLKDSFQDEDYDKFHFWVLGSSKNPDDVIIKAINYTNTDLSLPLSGIELEDKDKNEINIAPSLRSYQVQIPHGKSVTFAVPLESSINPNQTPCRVLFRDLADSSSSFFGTKNAFYPAEFAYSNTSDLGDSLTLEPDNYPSTGITWSDPILKKRKLTISVSMHDYFRIKYDAENFKLIGLNNNGSVGDKEKAISASPKEIKGNKGMITLKFDDLTAVKTYKKIALYYNDTAIAKIK